MWYIKYALEEEADGGAGAAASMSEAEIAARLASPDGVYEPKQEESDKGGEEDKKEEGAVEPNKENGDTFSPSVDWDIVKGIEGFKMPENLTKENEQEMLLPYIKQRFGIEDKREAVLHPVTQQIQDVLAVNPEMSLTDVVKEISGNIRDASTMSLEDKVRWKIFKEYGGRYDETSNPEGLRDEDVQLHLDKMDVIEKRKMAKDVDAEINAENETSLKAYKEKLAGQYEENYNNIVKNIENASVEIKSNLSSVEDIYGFPVNQEQLGGLIQEFKDFTTPNKETGASKLDEMLSDNTLLFKAFVVLMNGEEKMRELLTRGREDAKAAILEKLKLTPTFGGSQRGDDRKMTPEQEREALINPARK